MAAPQFAFKKATKEQSKLRLSIAGPAGAGKTYTGLRLASLLGNKVAVIDTERGSASKYADIFEFDVIELDDFHPENYIAAIRAAEQAGYDTLFIDSTTHEWNGRNGILELHEAAVQRQSSKNSFTAWAKVTPLHQKFIDAILNCKCHVLASVRSKTEYVQDKDDRGRTEVRKVGMASVQREGMDYEYDVMLEMSVDHVGVITKTRCAALDGRVFTKPGEELADILKSWLSSGAPATAKTPKPTTTEQPQETERPQEVVYISGADLRELAGLWAELVTQKTLPEYCIGKGYGKPAQIPANAAAILLKDLRAKKAEIEAAARELTPRQILDELLQSVADVISESEWKDFLASEHGVQSLDELPGDKVAVFTEQISQWAEAIRSQSAEEVPSHDE